MAQLRTLLVFTDERSAPYLSELRSSLASLWPRVRVLLADEYIEATYNKHSFGCGLIECVTTRKLTDLGTPLIASTDY